MHKISNVCRRTDNTLLISQAYATNTLYLGLIFFDGFESPIDLSIFFAYSWSSQNPGNVVRKKSILAEIGGN